MTRETIDGRAVFLRRTRSGFAVKWGNTVISHHKNAIDAIDEIVKMFLGGVV